MGGGDLNLKKSWHPSTLRNIERVWKAEQKHEVEKQKIEQLQKELAAERAREEIHAYAVDHGVVKKKEEKLDWMYQGPAAMVNREEFLLGRKIDKTFELIQQQETGRATPNDNDHQIGSLFSRQDLSGTATVDLANKIREDPLFTIMKKEKEQRKNLLTNPVKMKQLQKLLMNSLKKEGKFKNKKSKKKSKHSEKYSNEQKKGKKSSKRHKSDSSSESDSTEYENTRKHSKEVEYHKKKRESNDFKRDYKTEIKKSYRNDHHSHHSKEHKESSYKYQEKVYDKDYKSQRENVPVASNENKKRKLDPEERERRLKEMQENARWREEQRKRNTKRYREDDEKEEKYEKMHTENFIKPMLSKVAGKGSLEHRVKQKIFTIQRNSADMDKHFARR